jgi:PAS domain S-box-containing protein
MSSEMQDTVPPSSLFELAFNNAPTGNYLLSPTPDAVILAVNDAFLKTASRKREDLVGKSVFEAFPANPADLADTGVAALRESLARAIKTGKPDALPLQRYPIWVTGLDGNERYEERYWNAINIPVFAPDGKLVCISHHTTDVTEHMRAEEAMRKSEMRYRSLFESIDQGFCIIEMLFDEQDRPLDYRLIEVNPVFAQQTGLHNAQGKRMRDLVPQHEAHWFEIYGQVARTGNPVHFENEAKALNRWYDVYAFRTDDPEPNRVAILFNDITAQKRTEETLRKSERQAQAERSRLDAVLEAVPVGIVVSDADGSILLSNAANRRLWGSGHPFPKDVNEFREWKGWWADDSDRRGRKLAPDEWTTSRVLRGEEALQDVIEIESFDVPPVRRITLNSGAPIKDQEGRIVGAVVAQLDITEQVRNQEKLKQADRRKDEFLAMLAHELRNPLAPINAAADLLGLVRPDDARVKQTSEVISRQVRHMTALVDDLLDVSRVTRGLVSLQKSRLDVKRIIANAVEQVRPLIEARGHRLTVQTPPESAFVYGDEKRLIQVVTNLLNNAAKYTPEGGDITTSLEVDDDHVRMDVIDNGIGMEPDLVGRAFELFAQAERTPDRSQGGLGIGLALVKSLVELHDGSITAFSEGVGKGSRFSVCLPHVKDESTTSGTEHRADAAAAASEKLKVMVVDDNVDGARMLGMLVEALGHDVVIEHSARKAFELALAERPQVCLLDIGLPDMDGYELARRLRAHPETSKAALVAVTGYGQEQDRTAALDAGFDHHFAKPVDMARLESLLSGIEKK